ncbi:AI-2E family transporter [Azospirillum sp. SYSU D00513]|uniref:AI-2E family transporter n=1 Tax=Azospirillum sp. SYSU D00513 TaxID=2812561 RepID=UPI001A96DC7A|nr:AI-2E family transporter [Azospirillum sp. SYSU D00513]
MAGILRGWVRRTFSDPQVVTLLAVLLGGLAVLLLLGDVLAPLIAAIVIAYLLEGGTAALVRAGLPRTLASLAVSLLFLGALLGLLLFLVPLLVAQIAQVARLLPSVIGGLQDFLLRLPARYPDLFEAEQVSRMVDHLRAEILTVGQNLLVSSVAWLPTLFNLALYTVLLPMLVFFFLKDKDQLLDWATGYLPAHRPLADRVWREVHAETGRYIRGKVYQITIVGMVSYGAFVWLDLPFSALLAAASGLSALIPFVGAPLAGLPVAIVAYAQWGLSAETAWSLAVYTVIQVLDGFVLHPLLLSGVVNLHPAAIIAAALVFGEVWGFWGVFFAVPLASLVQAVLNAWPRKVQDGRLGGALGGGALGSGASGGNPAEAALLTRPAVGPESAPSGGSRVPPP